MRIGIVAPLIESVPPKLYGGTERIVSYLTEELVSCGHDVTLFASGDSITSGELDACVPRALRLTPDSYRDAVLSHLLMLERVYQRARDFDIIHFHIDGLHFSMMSRLGVPYVTTLHGRLDMPDVISLAAHFPKVPLVSISNSQREPMPQANWAATVYHGLPPDMFKFSPGPGEYLAFLGRIAPEKRPDRAIAIARATGVPLKIAAKVDKVDREYYETRIKPLLRGGGIEYIGEINESEKDEFLRKAIALLFPIDWPEPFGLVMIEAMACGTPVIAFRSGSVPEIIEDGINGYTVETCSEATAAVPKAAALDRQRIRKSFERRFTAPRMARDYISLYRRLCQPVPKLRSLRNGKARTERLIAPVSARSARPGGAGSGNTGHLHIVASKPE
ncbi:MAG: glycosyltransferase family 4 protein [Rhodospirillaceae bacterium]